MRKSASKSRVTIHRQTWVKVNAQVDAGIVSLIQALNSIPGVRTLESCEGDGDTAWVIFDAGEGSWEPLAQVVLESLGPSLTESFGDRVNLNVTVSAGVLYKAEMTVAKAIIPAVSDAINKLSKHAKAA